LADYYRAALGVLKFTPDQFRAMSPGEFILAMDGHLMSIGAYKSGLSWNDVLELESTIENRSV